METEDKVEVFVDDAIPPVGSLGDQDLGGTTMAYTTEADPVHALMTPEKSVRIASVFDELDILDLEDEPPTQTADGSDHGIARTTSAPASAITDTAVSSPNGGRPSEGSSSSKTSSSSCNSSDDSSSNCSSGEEQGGDEAATKEVSPALTCQVQPEAEGSRVPTGYPKGWRRLLLKIKFCL